MGLQGIARFIERVRFSIFGISFRPSPSPALASTSVDDLTPRYREITRTRDGGVTLRRSTPITIGGKTHTLISWVGPVLMRIMEENVRLRMPHWDTLRQFEDWGRLFFPEDRGPWSAWRGTQLGKVRLNINNKCLGIVIEHRSEDNARTQINAWIDEATKTTRLIYPDFHVPTVNYRLPHADDARHGSLPRSCLGIPESEEGYAFLNALLELQYRSFR